MRLLQIGCLVAVSSLVSFGQPGKPASAAAPAGDGRTPLAALVGQPMDYAAPANESEALNRFRGSLEGGIRIARAYVDYEKAQVSLGAIEQRDTYDAQATLSRLQAQLAAFDAGLFPKLPASPPTPQAQKAREDYRKLLVAAVGFAEKNYDASLQNYKLGKTPQADVLGSVSKFLDIQAQLAAFDAGLTYTR